MGITLGRDNVCYIHLTLVPFIPTAGEMKTKPTQHSVKELREIGIQPDVVLCRADRPIPDGDRRKIALFTNVAARSGHPGARRRLDLQDTGGAARRGPRRHRLQEARHRSAAREPVDVGASRRCARASRARRSHRDGRQIRRPDGIVQVAFRSADARRHPHALAGARSITSTRRRSSATASKRWRRWTRSWCPAASASAASRARSPRSATPARTGFRISGSASACSSRSSSTRATRRSLPTPTAPSSIRLTPHPVVALITEWQNRDGSIEKRDASSNLGGTMRLGAQPCDVVPGSLAHRIYGVDDGVRAPPPSLRGEQPLPAAHRGGGPGASARGPRARRRETCARWWSCRSIRGSSAASSTRSSRRTRARGHPLFVELRSCGDRAPAAHGAGGGRRAAAPRRVRRKWRAN